MHTLAGELRPAAGSVVGTAGVGHLPQDSCPADQSVTVTVTVTDRILSARGLDVAARALRGAEAATADGTDRSMNAYVPAEAEFRARGGYAAETSAVGTYPGAIISVTHDEGAADALRPDRVLLPEAEEDMGRRLSGAGGARARVADPSTLPHPGPG
ncbi:ATP-binding cassette domain-containing protein [Streptomyces collinus]|uniref:hypothetical protein n=1 Tax=Streptomyces collinus TaxID=42684 RepID=UPI0037FA6FF6